VTYHATALAVPVAQLQVASAAPHHWQPQADSEDVHCQWQVVPVPVHKSHWQWLIVNFTLPLAVHCHWKRTGSGRLRLGRTGTASLSMSCTGRSESTCKCILQVESGNLKQSLPVQSRWHCHQCQARAASECSHGVTVDLQCQCLTSESELPVNTASATRRAESLQPECTPSQAGTVSGSLRHARALRLPGHSESQCTGRPAGPLALAVAA
jgi:hypothetical protein